MKIVKTLGKSLIYHCSECGRVADFIIDCHYSSIYLCKRHFDLLDRRLVTALTGNK